jgi:hypothetical protein
MPSTSAKQHRFMEAVAHNPAFAKKAGVPQSVGKDFSEADKGRKFAKGGDMKDMKMTMKAGKVSKRMPMAEEMGGMNLKAGGMGYARGGGIESKGKTKGTMIKMAKGGYVRSADGCASSGKTKGTMV